MSRTPAQAAALDQVWSITASTTEAARARDERLLRENGWDVERTVNQIFSGGADAGSSTAASGAGPSRKAETEGSHMDGELGLGRRRPAPRARPGSAGLGLWETFAWPFSFIASLLTGAWYFFIRNFVPLSLLPHLPRFLLPPPVRGPPRGPRDPTTASMRFVRDLETLTGGSAAAGTLPDLWVGPYRDFLSEVRKQGKVGVVVLVCGEHEDDEEFKRDVLADPEFVRCLKEHDILIWAADIGSREGYMVSQTLLTTTYPALTFTSLLPVQNSGTPRLTILSTIAGPPGTTTSTPALLQTITTSVLPRTNAFLQRLRRERLTLEEARHLREEQDRAFREAERKDRERLHAARAAAELERVQRERAERDAAAKAKAAEDRALWRRYARKHLLAPSAGPVRVALRTPINADRHVYQFTPGQSTLPLFVFAETRLIPPDCRPEDDPDSPPEGYNHAWGFRLVTSYPRREVELVEHGGETVWADVKQAGGALFAEKIPGGDWGDAEIRAARAANGDDSDDDEEEVLSD